nr:phosphotransferase [Legionella jordanis]
MTFKQHWEKTDVNHTLPDEIVDGMLALAFPKQKIHSKELISGGCANLNYRITLVFHEKPKILRIYLRDHEAAYCEQQLGSLLKNTVPIPEIYSIADYGSYRFAVAEFMPGISLRDLLLNNPKKEFRALMVDVGLMLTKIRTPHFEYAGCFDRDLKITEPIPQNGYRKYAQNSLNEPIVHQLLAQEVVNQISDYFKQLHLFFPDEQEKNLVHADFDPANILVVEKNNEWQISGILDWEFAFSGSSLCDVANMLRYAHQMPTWFEDGFLSGIEIGSYSLPKNWRTSVFLLNLSSLLDCLVRSCDKRPNQRKDICLLIDYILLQLNQLYL